MTGWPILGAQNGAVRVTFDRRVSGEWTTTWDVIPVRSTVERLPNLVICEFKYRLSMPRMFKEIVETFGLQPTACSKYRRSDFNWNDQSPRCSLYRRWRGCLKSQVDPLSDSVGGIDPVLGVDELLMRLGLGAAFGIAVGAVYFLTQKKKRADAASFVSTLVLLAILLAMVSMVIGSDIARAFSLVGGAGHRPLPDGG